MSEYGVTATGFVKKRLDKIIEETQKYLTEELGFDVSLNPQSALNVLITNQADRFAQLWEVAEQVYYSLYPSTAEGVSLDNVGQFAGVIREGDQRTQCLVLCTGTDGTTLPKGSVIASATSPKILFTLFSDKEISRLSFNKAVIKVVTAMPRQNYTVTINGTSYPYLTGDTDTGADIITKLAGLIKEPGFTVKANGSQLEISCDSNTASNHLELSDNLTTESVSSLVLWQSGDYGKFVLPEHSITEIVTTVKGFDSCYNVSIPLYGRLRETDTEFRQSFINKRGTRSYGMLESITSALLEKVDGVLSATAYENCEDSTNSAGIPPHSIEVVVDGGNNAEIASVILNTKAAGIGTHGDVSVDVPTSNGDTVKVKFNRPEYVYVWYKVTVTKNANKIVPPNYKDLVKTAILECMNELTEGDAVITQDYISHIKSLCAGLAYIDITIGSTTSNSATPTSYKERNLFVTSKQKAVSSFDRIEVIDSGT